MKNAISLSAILLLCTLLSPMSLRAQVVEFDEGDWDFSQLMDSTRGKLPNSLEAWKTRLELFGSNIPQEEVFVHMDNTCYFLGDTLYYKAYVRRSDTGRLTDLSHVLYTELWNQDGYLVERQQIRLNQGQGFGSFVLQDTLYAGYYELRAYTRWQLNWGEYQHDHTPYAEEFFLTRKMAKEYYRDYEKLYSRIFPLYNKPEEPGAYNHDMTTRPMRRYFRTDVKKPDPIVTCYPEGGVIVEGTDARVAFEANEEDGEHISGRMTLTTSRGDTVVTAHTENRGRGTLEFHYDPDVRYRLVFVSDSGEVIKAKLPDAERDGCALRCEVVGDSVHITMQPRGTAAHETLGLTVMTGGALRYFRKFAAMNDEDENENSLNHKPLPISLNLSTDSLPSGVAQFTVYNAQGRVYSDRLLFIRHNDLERSQVGFSGMKHIYNPFDSIHVAVDHPQAAGSTISVAVRDAAYSEYLYDSSNMLTEMLLCSQIKGFVEQPDYYFEQDDVEHNRHLDLLMMVQGWRRFNWLTMATPGLFQFNHPVETLTPILYGTVSDYFTPEKEGVRGFGGSFYNQEDLYDYSRPNGGRGFYQRSGVGVGAVPTLGKAAEILEYNSIYSQLHNKKAKPAEQQYLSKGYIDKEVLVHAEFIQPGTKNGLVGEVETTEGRFTILAPSFEGICYMFLSASDTTKWKKPRHFRYKGRRFKVSHEWISNDEDALPEFYVRLIPYFPRFVKPFSFYHLHVPPAREGSVLSGEMRDDVYQLRQLTIRMRHGGLRAFDINAPALVMDAYDAYNEVADAGFTPAYFSGANHFAQWIMRNYVGDMNLYRPYNTSSVNEYYLHLNGFGNGHSRYASAYGEREDFNHLRCLDRIQLFTDYCPRQEGSRRYWGSDQPTVSVNLVSMPNSSQRISNRDRRYYLRGFAICEDFYQPNYAKRPLPEVKDYRRTLYWNPNVSLDANGHADLHFYNNSRQTAITVSAEGLSPEGQILTGISYPEDR